MSKVFYITSDQINVTQKAIGETPSEDTGIRIAGYANTVTKDRMNEVIVSSAWHKGVEQYKKNPILLYQHKQDMPIGKVEKITIDEKGLFIDGFISKAAEDLYGVQTLIRDGVLKTFSVGFIPKNGKYDQKKDVLTITEVELLEVSVVSIPANQDSIFSIKKSFENETEYQEFVKTFETNETGVSAGITKSTEGHYHAWETDENGNGVTTYASHGQKHVHQIIDGVMQETEGHTHKMNKQVEETLIAQDLPITQPVDNEEPLMSPAEAMATSLGLMAATATELPTPSEKEHEGPKENEVEASVPYYNPVNPETALLAVDSVIQVNNKRFKITQIATVHEPIFKLLEIDLNGDNLDNTLEIKAQELVVVNSWDIGTQFDKIVAQKTEDVDLANYAEVINASEYDLFKQKDQPLNDVEAFKLNRLLNFKTIPVAEWTENDRRIASHLVFTVTELLKLPESKERNKQLALNGHIVKENDMTTQSVGDAILVETKAEGTTITPTVEVGPDRTELLIQETGKAIMKQADAQDRQMFAENKSSTYTPSEDETVRALKAELAAVREQVASVTASKMLWTQQNSAGKIDEKEAANAVFLRFALGNKRAGDVFDTKLGARYKAITSVDAFLSNFSTTVYEEMQQQLVVVPMFERLSVDARTFRVPVADEDTNGDVAQFQSGTFSQGVADSTRVPTTRQNSITAVEFTPHKFMATTHLAKDEEEDTILPLIDFLRSSATRRMARALDKAVLRGDGSLTGFNASPTNAITVGSGYASVIKGVATLANDISGLRQDVGASTAATPASIAAARAKMGKYGLQLGNNLVYLTTVEGYNSLIQTTDFRTVDKFGPNATYLTGAVGAVYGIPVMITEFLDVKGSSNNQIGLMVYKPGFRIAERRAMELESEYDARRQVTALYLSTRIDIKALTTNASAALDTDSYAYACVVRSA